MSGVRRKSLFAYTKTKMQITAKLISAFVFASYVVLSVYFLNPKFQASSHLLYLYSLVCVGPGRKPERLFSHDAAHIIMACVQTTKSDQSFHRQHDGNMSDQASRL